MRTSDKRRKNVHVDALQPICSLCWLLLYQGMILLDNKDSRHGALPVSSATEAAFLQRNMEPPPPLLKVASLGDPGFADRLAAGQAAAAAGEVDDSFEAMEENDRLEDIQQDFPAVGAQLKEMPQQTLEHDAIVPDDDESADDDRQLETLTELFGTLNSIKMVLDV